MSARGLIQLFRSLNPSMLHRKDRVSLGSRQHTPRIHQPLGIKAPLFSWDWVRLWILSQTALVPYNGLELCRPSCTLHRFCWHASRGLVSFCWILFFVLRGNPQNRLLRHRYRIMVNLGQRTISLVQRFWKWTRKRRTRRRMVRIWFCRSKWTKLSVEKCAV